MTMKLYLKSTFLRQTLLVVIGLPLLILVAGNFQERSLLKEFLSVMTILAFFQMPGQFFWARAGRFFGADLKMSKVVQYHKIIGYLCVAILMLHPFYIVLPRFFESGVSPIDAFVTIITTMNIGVVLGIIAWCLMLVLGGTSLFRASLPMNYKTWRVVHGLLAVLFVVAAAWHVIDLGRHSTAAMSFFIVMLTAGGILLFLRSYTAQKSKSIVEA